ncbi:YafY family protein [Paenibacillus sp. L3-i20]|uniref:helix-turn-helix transcriptional regulator n=1 Tax=Paenibacillus sp. L3-i20 TaxID=2905833 RepID=UPI001EE03D49|nr:YafY family protein [Paenibacillus sp. L3-i20]GKU77527.1 putative HTH-type transcriptional regulator YobV [Paenibacillus sp. L3-i20]
MKLDRLLSIVILLLNRRIVQAKDLAEQFEVSVRTIYRDIEAINQSGIPIVTYQGTNGGIGLAEGYRLDRNLLTNAELTAIVTALRSMSTSYDQHLNALLMEKLTSIIPASQTESFVQQTNQVLIDFTTWGEQGPLEKKQYILKKAINDNLIVQFLYSDAQGKLSLRQVEPHTLLWKVKHWYLQAFCLDRNDFRTFKLLRMKNLETMTATFIRKPVPSLEYRVDEGWHDSNNMATLTLHIHNSATHIAEEYFDIEDLEPLSKGDWLVKTTLPENDWLYGCLLGFGPAIEVIEPAHIRVIIAEKAARIQQLYSNNEQ